MGKETLEKILATLDNIEKKVIRLQNALDTKKQKEQAELKKQWQNEDAERALRDE